MRLAWFLSMGGKELPRAEELLREALQAPGGLPTEDLQHAYGVLMDVCALQEKWDELASALRQTILSGGTVSPMDALAMMEEALDREGKQAEFIAFCETAKALYAQAGLPLHQWYLEPATPNEEFCQRLFRDEYDGAELRSDWRWHDLVQASSYSLSDRPGHLTLRAGSGVSLWPGSGSVRGNLNAPRILVEARGDFALETKMERDERGGGPSGLLIWKDVLNYVRLDKHGVGGHRESTRLQGRIQGEFRVWGQGLLRGSIFCLRLERNGDRFAALCSTDGVHWLTCGHVDFPVKDPLRVGVWAGSGSVIYCDYVHVLGRA